MSPNSLPVAGSTTGMPAGMSSPSLMTTAATASGDLARARQLKFPSQESILRRDPKVYDFWNQNDELLVDAWKEWQNTDKVAQSLPKLDPSVLINPKLHHAIEEAWKNPTLKTEDQIKELWEEVAPGVWAIPFFNLDKIDILRQWLDAVPEAGIPVRPPYGIVLNRKGLMTDPHSVGYLAAPAFQEFYRELVDRYVRPLGRVFFPSSIMPDQDDADTFSFSIQYQGENGGDKSIRPHSDASTLTFNLNLDAKETWTGSSLIFYDKGQQHSVEWKPGYAVMHLGSSMHAAVPIETGTRSNWVIWTRGRNDQSAYGGMPTMEDGTDEMNNEKSAPQERWTIPTPSPINPWDRWSPF